MKNGEKQKPVKTVEEYLARLPEDQRAALQRLRSAIMAAAPAAEEVISYQVPTYKLNGTLVCFGAWPKHCSLYAASKQLLALYADELKNYKISGTTIHFTPEKPLPISLIKRIVKARVKANAERVALKKKVQDGASK